jgi:hypothetical protein
MPSVSVDVMSCATPPPLNVTGDPRVVPPSLNCTVPVRELPATEEFQRAIALYPDYMFAHMWYGQCLACMGRLEEGLAENRRALQLDPVSLAAHVT